MNRYNRDTTNELFRNSNDLFRVKHFGVYGSKFRVKNSEFEVKDSGSGTQDLGDMVSTRPAPLSVRANSLFKLENRNLTRLVQKPDWAETMGKSENVYSGTWTFCLFDCGKAGKSVYRSTHVHFCP